MTSYEFAKDLRRMEALQEQMRETAALLTNAEWGAAINRDADALAHTVLTARWFDPDADPGPDPGADGLDRRYYKL